MHRTHPDRSLMAAAGVAVAMLMCTVNGPTARAAIGLSTVPFTDPLRQEAVFLSLVNLISAELGMEVRYVPVPSYEALIMGFERGTIDVAMIGVVTYVEARRRARVKAILRPIRVGRSFYSGAILVRRDAGLTKIEQLKGKRFAFVDRFSTAGFLFPTLLFKRAGLDPAQDFAEVRFVGGHAQVVEAIANGQVDAGACFRGCQRFLAEPDKLNIIALTDLIPNDPVVVSATLPDPVVQRLREIFIELAFQPRARVFFELMNIEGFLPATDEQYKQVVVDIQELRAR